MSSDYRIRPIDDQDRSWIGTLIKELWQSDSVVAHGVIFKPAELPGFIADDDGEPLGLITYRIAERECEIVTLDSLRESIGIGTTLVDAVMHAALEAGCTRLRVITTNDNLLALGFYQKRGFQIFAVHPNALEKSRQLKPEIPLIGTNGIPIRDEIELELIL